MEFLQGLNDRFSVIRSQILLMDPLPNATKMYSLVRQEEKQQEIQSMLSPTPEAAALNTIRSETHWVNSQAQTNGHVTNGPVNRQFGGNRKPRQRPHCDYCGRDGHFKATCYKIHGFPQKTTNQVNVVEAVKSDEKPTMTPVPSCVPHHTPKVA